MEVARDLIRDLVGILFPGGLLVIFTLWAFWALTMPFAGLASISILPTDKGIIVILIMSYVAGQSLRMKQLTTIEKKCTEEYRKENFSDKTAKEWDTVIEGIDKEAKAYYSGESSLERLKEAYKECRTTFPMWEKFPYGYHLTARRLLLQPEGYIKFFEKYDKQGLPKTETFFNLCKSVIYEYSPSFKEEVLRQESLVRLFAGIYYVIKYGKVITVGVGVFHITLIAVYCSKFKPAFLSTHNVGLSVVIVAVSIFALWALFYMNREILERLRYMRVKELNLAYDGFFLVCKKHNLDI